MSSHNFLHSKKSATNYTLFFSRDHYQFGLKTSVLPLRASSERLSEHSAGYLQYFMATYKTIGYQILVRRCGPEEKQNLKTLWRPGLLCWCRCTPPEMYGTQTPTELPWWGWPWAGNSEGPLQFRDCTRGQLENGGDSCFASASRTSTTASFPHGLGDSSTTPFCGPRR